jgi:hypothetical protein
MVQERYVWLVILDALRINYFNGYIANLALSGRLNDVAYELAYDAFAAHRTAAGLPDIPKGTYGYEFAIDCHVW